VGKTATGGDSFYQNGTLKTVSSERDFRRACPQPEILLLVGVLVLNGGKKGSGDDLGVGCLNRVNSETWTKLAMGSPGVIQDFEWFEQSRHDCQMYDQTMPPPPKDLASR